VRLVISVIIAAITAAMFTLPLSVTSTAQARTMRIMYSPGGEVDAFIKKFNTARRDNTLVILDGQCISACTLSASLIKPERVCVTPFAQLVFHSAWYENDEGEIKFAKDATDIIYHSYPLQLRKLLHEKGWDGGEHRALIFIEGDELLSVVRACTAAEMKQNHI
jgi:hypothetical protein